MYDVTIMDEDKKYYKFQWKVEKYKSSGPLKDCWLTTSVSQPLDMGSSISVSYTHLTLPTTPYV